MWGRLGVVLMGLLLGACAGSPPIEAVPSEPTGPLISGSPQSANQADARFRLTVTSDQVEYRAGQLITVTAAVTFLGSADAITASGSGTLVGFGLTSAGSGIAIEPIFTGDCHLYSFTRDSSVAFPFVKSGGTYGPNQALTAFLQEYFSSPDLRLPAGSWTIRAQTTIYHDPDCSGSPSELAASLALIVEP